MQNFITTNLNINDFKDNLNEKNGKNFMEIVRDLIKFDPFQGHKFYIFSIIKKEKNERFTQPRLTKPYPVPGGTLIQVDPQNPDWMKTCWTLPDSQDFHLFKYKKVFGDRFVWECIYTYLKNPEQLMCPEDGDLPEEKMRELRDLLDKRIGEIRQKEKSQRKVSSSYEEAPHLELCNVSDSPQ